MDKELDEKIKRAFHNPKHPASFSSSAKLYRELKSEGVSRGQIERWLKRQDDYTLHRFRRQRFPRRRVIVGSIDYQWDADLVDMTSFASNNSGYKFILVAIDILSRFLWT